MRAARLTVLSAFATTILITAGYAPAALSGYKVQRQEGIWNREIAGKAATHYIEMIATERASTLTRKIVSR
jgi:hypothetical protein